MSKHHKKHNHGFGKLAQDVVEKAKTAVGVPPTEPELPEGQAPQEAPKAEETPKEEAPAQDADTKVEAPKAEEGESQKESDKQCYDGPPRAFEDSPEFKDIAKEMYGDDRCHKEANDNTPPAPQNDAAPEEHPGELPYNPNPPADKPEDEVPPVNDVKPEEQPVPPVVDPNGDLVGVPDNAPNGVPPEEEKKEEPKAEDTKPSEPAPEAPNVGDSWDSSVEDTSGESKDLTPEEQPEEEKKPETEQEYVENNEFNPDEESKDLTPEQKDEPEEKPSVEAEHVDDGSDEPTDSVDLSDHSVHEDNVDDGEETSESVDLTPEVKEEEKEEKPEVNAEQVDNGDDNQKPFSLYEEMDRLIVDGAVANVSYFGDDRLTNRVVVLNSEGQLKEAYDYPEDSNVKDLSYQAVEWDKGDQVVWCLQLTDEMVNNVNMTYILQTGPYTGDDNVFTPLNDDDFLDIAVDVRATAFLLNTSDENRSLNDEYYQKTVIDVHQSVKALIGEGYPIGVNYFTTVFATAKEGVTVPAWEEADSLEEGDSVVYGIKGKFEDFELSEGYNTSIFVWTRVNPEDENDKRVLVTYMNKTLGSVSTVTGTAEFENTVESVFGDDSPILAVWELECDLVTSQLAYSRLLLAPEADPALFEYINPAF